MNLHVIPNSLIAALGLGFYAYALLTGMPSEQIIWHSQVSIMALIAAFIAFAFKALNAGVAKLIAIAFLWFGVSSGLTFTMVSLGLTFLWGYIAGRLNKSDVAPYLPFAALTAAYLIVMGGGLQTEQVSTEVAAITAR